MGRTSPLGGRGREGLESGAKPPYRPGWTASDKAATQRRTGRLWGQGNRERRGDKGSWGIIRSIRSARNSSSNCRDVWDGNSSLTAQEAVPMVRRLPANDRYPFSPRIRTLREILHMIRPEPLTSG
jgi:hypothetical protein